MIHRKFPWMNFIVFGSIALLADGALIYTLATEQTLVADLIAGGVTLVFNALAAIVIAKWYLGRPNYFTYHRTAVWTSGLEISKQLMEDALDFYVHELTQYSNNREEYRQKVLSMLDGMCIEWTKKKISSIGIGWQVRDKEGLQSGKNIMVRWPGSICESALFHELHHAVDEFVFKIPPDYKHERVSWWGDVVVLNKAYRKIELGY